METYFILAWAALSAGLLGSPHCIGMCGGLVSAFGYSIQSQSPSDYWRFTTLYHLGRLLTYSLLGVLAGIAGHLLTSHLHPTPFPRLLIAAILILMGLTMLGSGSLSFLEKAGARLWAVLAPIRKKLFPIDRPQKALGIGLIWGFLPCGLVYAALLTSLGASRPAVSGAYMFLFGLGTMPALLLTSAASQTMKQFFNRFHIRQLNGIFLVACGVWLLVPTFQHMQHSQHQQKPAAITHTELAAPSTPQNNMEDMDHMHHH